MTTADEFLEHYGVAGMKWGKRKSGNLASRYKGAALDRNQRKLARYTRVSEGRGSLIDKNYVLNRTNAGQLIAKKGLKNVATVKMSKLLAQRDRIESGKTTVLDKLETIMSTSTSDLYVSKTDNRG